MISESLIRPVVDQRGCTALEGLWYDSYTGQTFITAADLDVDHFVSLAEVHRSGGSSWTALKRRQYANDLSDSATLMAVSRSAKASKGDGNPHNALPNTAYRCTYVTNWVQIKRKWELEIDAAEAAAIAAVLENCKVARQSSPSGTATAPEVATIWLYRTKSSTDSMLNPTIFARGKELAKLEKGQFFSLTVPAGTHYFSWTDRPKEKEEALVELKPGQMVFLKVRIGKSNPSNRERRRMTSRYQAGRIKECGESRCNDEASV